MGLLDGLLGHGSEIGPDEVDRQLAGVLAPGESVRMAFKVIRDLIVFTDRRMILVDKQGMTGRKVSYHSVPYKSITHFTVETAGTFDLDAELTIWISGGQGITKQFGRGVDVYEVQALLAAFVAR